jgi:hypothetical protein
MVQGKHISLDSSSDDATNEEGVIIDNFVVGELQFEYY